MKILFIEDDVHRNRPVVSYIEAVEGWEVIWATTPKSALEKLKEETGINVILLDIMMPADEAVEKEKSNKGLSTGILLIDEIQKITKDKIPIILLTARLDLQWLVKKKKVKGYLRKPISAQEIITTIDRMIGK